MSELFPAANPLASAFDDGVLTLSLQRAEDGNRIDVALSDALHAALQDATWNDEVRVVVIEGRGVDFCRGVDGSDFDERYDDPAERRAAFARFSYWRDRLLPGMPKPVIASVRGACLGGSALAVVAACDLAFAADDATFALDGSDPEAHATEVAATIGRVVTNDSTSTLARGCNAEQAERIGLVTRVVPLAGLDGEVGTVARELAAKDPIALRFTKQTVRHVGSMSWDAAVDYTAAKFAQLKALQADRPSTRAAAVESFLSGRSKPGLGS